MRQRICLFTKYVLLIFMIPVLSAQTGSWFVDTVAGTDRPVNDGGRGTLALLNTPGSVVPDAAGNVIFADSGNHRVRRIAPDGTITTIAGTGIPGYSGDGGPAGAAQLVTPQGLALDAAGNLYISDYSAHVVRMLGMDGSISTVAGNGLPGNTGTGGSALAASLNGPYALAIDKAGNLYIAEDLGNLVRKVTPDGRIVAFTSERFVNPEGLAIDAAGNVYIASWGSDKIYRATPSGTVTTFAGNGNYGFSGDGGQAVGAAFASPMGITFDAAGSLWICDSSNNRIRKITSDGIIQTVIGSGSAGLNGFSGDPKAASVYTPAGVAIDTKGFVVWSEAGNNRIRSFNPGNRQITEIGGSAVPLNSTGGATSQLLFNPFSATTDTAGNLYIADSTNNVIRKITPAGVSSIFAGTGSPNYNGEVGPANTINLTHPQGVAADAQGNIYIADSGSGRVRKVDSTGRISTLMGSGSGLPFSGTFAGNAFLFTPTGVVANPAGGFVVVDQIFSIVASVDALGTIKLLPTASVNFLTYPAGIAIAGTTIYIADTFSNRILKSTPTEITVIAGTGAPGYSGDNGPAAQAKLFLPNGVAVDTKGNVYIADTLNSAIRMIDTTGKITTLAGNGKPGFSGDKGAALNAQFAFPRSVSVDSAGNIQIADTGNQRIRQLKFLVTPPDLTITTDAASKSANHGSTVPVQLALTSMGGFAGTASLSASGPGGVGFQFTPSGTLSVAVGQSVSVTANVTLPATMALGTYTLGFTVTAGTVQHTANVAFTVTNLPQFPAAGVVSAATGAGGGVSPGKIVAVYGQDLGPADLALGAFDASNTLSTLVGGTQVLFDGKAAPLIYSVAGQLSAIVPYAVAGKSSTRVQIVYNGRSSMATAVNVVDAAPGIFNIPGSAQAAALNADLSINNAGNPAAKGSVVVLFATGEGQTDPGGVDGKIATEVFPKPLLPVSVMIGGQAADILYRGAAPFQVAGVVQLNVRLPAGTASGAVPVTMQVGSRANQGMSTVAVQ